MKRLARSSQQKQKRLLRFKYLWKIVTLINSDENLLPTWQEVLFLKNRATFNFLFLTILHPSIIHLQFLNGILLFLSCGLDIEFCRHINGGVPSQFTYCGKVHSFPK